MKTIFIGILSFLSIFLWANDISDKNVTYDQLPRVAQIFLSNHFSGENILYIEYDRELGDKDYTVHYENGIEVKFDKSGEWLKVENEYGPIPQEIIPEKVMTNIEQRHPKSVVTSISRKMKGREKGYEVEIDKRPDMKFDLNGKFLRYDD